MSAGIINDAIVDDQIQRDKISTSTVLLSIIDHILFLLTILTIELFI